MGVDCGGDLGGPGDDCEEEEEGKAATAARRWWHRLRAPPGLPPNAFGCGATTPLWPRNADALPAERARPRANAATTVVAAVVDAAVAAAADELHMFARRGGGAMLLFSNPWSLVRERGGGYRGEVNAAASLGLEALPLVVPCVDGDVSSYSKEQYANEGVMTQTFVHKSTSKMR